MPIVYCKICKKNFYTKPNWLERGHGKYCSRECQYKAQRKGNFVNCHKCGKTIWRQPRFLKSSKIFFCTKDCMMKWRNNFQRGAAHPNWMGGKYIDYESLLIRMGVEPICKRCSRRDKRILLVHHVDGDRLNNHYSNLNFLCYNCHWLVHKHKESLKSLK